MQFRIWHLMVLVVLAAVTLAAARGQVIAVLLVSLIVPPIAGTAFALGVAWLIEQFSRIVTRFREFDRR